MIKNRDLVVFVFGHIISSDHIFRSKEQTQENSINLERKKDNMINTSENITK